MSSGDGSNLEEGGTGGGVMNFTSLHSTVYTVEPPISGHAETKAACPES